MTRTCREAGLFQKSWHELAGKLAYFKKHDTNLQGSWLISKNMTRICREAGFSQKSWHELAGKLGSCKSKPGFLQKSGGKEGLGHSSARTASVSGRTLIEALRYGN